MKRTPALLVINLSFFCMDVCRRKVRAKQGQPSSKFNEFPHIKGSCFGRFSGPLLDLRYVWTRERNPRRAPLDRELTDGYILVLSATVGEQDFKTATLTSARVV
jgi:hypothetical protein